MGVGLLLGSSSILCNRFELFLFRLYMFIH